MQCAVLNVQYEVVCVQCGVCSVQCTVCNVQCEMYSVQCTVCNVQCAMYSVQSTEAFLSGEHHDAPVMPDLTALVGCTHGDRTLDARLLVEIFCAKDLVVWEN